MPICKNCQEPFPNRLVINGKERVLNRRKYCLECSPWGKHNTSQIHLKEHSDNKILICQHCGKPYIRKYNLGSSIQYCNSCMANRQRYKKKELAVEYKGGKCQQCGYSKCKRNLCFHHTAPNEKDFTISSNHCFSWEKIKKELDKCILLCMNCHGEVHDQLNPLKPW